MARGTTYQFVENENAIIVDGCRADTGLGDDEGLTPLLQIPGVTTPLAVRTTGEFKIQVYKAYDAGEDKLSDEIVRGSAFLGEDAFQPGVLVSSQVTVEPLLVQSPSLVTLEFALAGVLPAESEAQGSRIVVIMPEGMTETPDEQPAIESLTTE